MGKSRKTIPVSDVIELINDTLSYTTNINQQSILCFMAERILMDTNNYHGFQWYKHGKQINTDEAKDMYPNHPDYFSRKYYLPK